MSKTGSLPLAVRDSTKVSPATFRAGGHFAGRPKAEDLDSHDRVLGLGIAGIVAMIKGFSDQSGSCRKTVLEILLERSARGEIHKKEHEQTRSRRAISTASAH